MLLRNTLVGLFGLTLMMSISLAQIVGCLLLVLWWHKERSNLFRASLLRSAPALPIVVFFIWALIEFAIHRNTTFLHALSSQSAFLLFFWGAEGADENDLQRLLKWMCIGAAIAGAWGLLQIIGGIHYRPTSKIFEGPSYIQDWPQWLLKKISLHNGRAVGPRSHPLTYAESFIPALFLMILFARRRWVWGVGLSLVVGGVFVAQGRAVWLGLLVGISVFGAAMGRRFFFKTMGAMMMVVALLFVISPQFRGRFLSVVSTQSGSVGDQESKSVRVLIWKSAMNEIKTRPLMGVGLEGARFVVFDRISGKNRDWTEAHNIFLQAGVELGLVGLGLLLWILISCARSIWLSASPLRPAYLGMFAAFLVAGLTESWLRDKEIAMLFWLMMGVVVNRSSDEA